MLKLEDLRPNASVRGILADAVVEVVSVQWHGSDALTLLYRGTKGVAEEILYRHDEPRLLIVEAGRPWSFDGNGADFRLVAEAHRIKLAHLFDPILHLNITLSGSVEDWQLIAPSTRILAFHSVKFGFNFCDGMPFVFLQKMRGKTNAYTWS